MTKAILDQVKINSSYIMKHESIDVFGYTFYKFFYNNYQDLPNDVYKKLIYYRS